MKAIGLDVGDRRIGVAKTDALNITAQGVCVVYVKSKIEKTYEQISQIIKEENADTLVVGLPRNMNGTFGPQAEKVQNFVGNLQEYTTVEVEYFDERLTTVSAQRALLEGDVSRKKRKTVVDELAAVIILQSWMDWKKNCGR
ncbi:Holliday junction resolvase RuvX [Clostridia bacterium]|nr:Holliday junction resolvase RuvX [Clostridia bacterium]